MGVPVAQERGDAGGLVQRVATEVPEGGGGGVARAGRDLGTHGERVSVTWNTWHGLKSTEKYVDTIVQRTSDNFVQPNLYIQPVDSCSCCTCIFLLESNKARALSVTSRSSARSAGRCGATRGPSRPKASAAAPRGPLRRS